MPLESHSFLLVLSRGLGQAFVSISEPGAHITVALAGEAMLIAVTSVPAATTPTNNATIIAFLYIHIYKGGVI
jgi:hypothetical protein